MLSGCCNFCNNHIFLQFTFLKNIFQIMASRMICYWGLPTFDPVVMPCKTLLKMATQGGANAIGHGDTLGTVEVGKKADVILVNLNQPHFQSSQSLLNPLVCSGSGRDVTDSIIDGKIVMKDREVLTMDEEEVMYKARIHMHAIIRRAW